ncbi:hypothetical protein [Cryptosporangium aurantiacum]|uniref:Uncharacterized protein n=1 Tax=Cryptosporangium aurantiacum TaxID=134849 RepID=A0A1M7RN54_9ACTN|nr:hypothetical protein [Cryptosporangium aurantiacum]SHN47496.1 hypothetical protein SAMN05443668_12454 [Cryptosporangium aurantiacum]
MGVSSESAALEWNWILRGRPWCAHEAGALRASDGEHLICVECGALWWHHGSPPPPRGEGNELSG